MCTVTFLPIGGSDFILTSSRDIPFGRKKALLPKKYIESKTQLWYAKDGKAGGTWMGLSANARLICLLNGAFEYHTSRAYYKKSRGLIVKELLIAKELEQALQNIDLQGVEQFTLSIVQWKQGLELKEFVWDGKKKHLKNLPIKPTIWSSSTLYDNEVKALRQDWFRSFIEQNEFTQANILDFHHSAGIGDPFIDVLMDRGMGGTVSISSFQKKGTKQNLKYEDILSGKKKALSF